MLATVTAGLYIELQRSPADQLATRLQGVFFWEFFMYVIEGMVFLITGLQARTLIPPDIDDFRLSQLALSIAVMAAVVIVARFLLGVSRGLSSALADSVNRAQ